MVASKGKTTKKSPPILVECEWGHLCSLSSIDQERNNISLFNVIEQLNVDERFFLKQKEKGTPLFLPMQCELVLSWRRVQDAEVFDEEIETDFKIKLVDPFGSVLQETIVPLKIQKQKKRTRFRVVLKVLPLTVSGNYRLDVEKRTLEKENFKRTLSISLDIKSSRL